MKSGLVGSVSLVALVALSGCGGNGGGDVKSSGSLAPAAAVTPTPVANPTPTPVAEPAPAPVAAPAPDPVAAPISTPDPAPVASPIPAPVVAVEPEPVPTPAPNPAPPAVIYPDPVAPPAGYLITPAAKQVQRSANDTSEYRANFVPSELVNGLYALDSGHTGQGVTVGVTDDGAINVNGELDGRISSMSKDFGYVTAGGVRTKRDTLGDEQSDHGTAVANIIGAAANGTGTVGYAPGVKIAVLRISDWDADTKTETLTHVIEAIDYAGKQGIKILNSSLSTGGNAVWGSAVTRFAATGGLIVKSAGNDAGASPDDAPAINDSNRGAILFVGALAPYVNAYQLETYSDRAGTMMDRYVVAVGRNTTTLVGGTTAIFAGTSSAAPVVTGLVADIVSKWPQLSGQQAGTIVLNTAKDIGDPGVDAVFGHGLVDFKAALAPVNPTLSNGVTQTSLSTSAMILPDMIGVEAIHTALSDVTLLDAYGRNYSGSIAAMVAKPQMTDPHRIARRMRQLGNQIELSYASFSANFGYAQSGPRSANGGTETEATSANIAYAVNGTGVRMAWNAASSLQTDVMGLAPFADGVIAYAPQADNNIGVDRVIAGGKLGLTVAFGSQAGGEARAFTSSWSTAHTDLRLSLIDERDTIMGVPTGSGALRLGRGARTIAFELHRTFDFARGWRLEGYGSVGVTRLKIDKMSLVTGATPLIGSRMGLQATHAAFGGQLSFGAAQPLRIESGAARLTYGTGYDLAAQALRYATTSASLAGTRRVQLTAGYAKAHKHSSLRLGVMRDLVDGATSALGGWNLRW